MGGAGAGPNHLAELEEEERRVSQEAEGGEKETERRERRERGKRAGARERENASSSLPHPAHRESKDCSHEQAALVSPYR